MPRSRNSRSASPQKPVSAESSEIERRKTYQNVHDIFCEAIDGDVIKLVLQECNWKEEESIEKLLVIAESQEEQKRYKSKLHRIAEGIFGSLRSEDYSSTGVSSTLSPSEKVIRPPLKTSTLKNDNNGDKAPEGILPRGPQNQAYMPHSQPSENVGSVDEIEMDLNFPHLPSRLSENNLSSASSSVHSYPEVSKKKPSSSKTALLSQAQSAFNQQFDDAEGSQRWEECKDKLSEHYLTNLKDSNDSVPKQIPNASVYPDDPAILQAELARPRSEPVHAKLDVEKQRSESGRSFPVRLLSRSPDSTEDMKTLPTLMLGHGAMKIAGTDDFMRSTGDIDDTVLKCIYEIHSDLLDEEEIQHRLRAQNDSISDTSAADNKSSTHSSNKPMTLPTIGLSVNAAEFVPRSKPVATTSSEVVDSPSPEPASRTKRSNSVEIKAGVKNASISSPSIPIRSPLTISPALSPGLSPQMNSPVANLTGSPMFITPKWPQVHSGMPPLQHVVLAPPQQYVHPTPAHHISPPAYRFPTAASVPYSTRMVYSVAPSPLFRAAGVSPYVQQSNTQNMEERAAVATGQPIMATSESAQLGQPTAALNTTKLVAQSSFEQKVEKIRKQHQSGVKILIILRGLPGSGKTTLARALQFHGIVLSTDDFFMNGNRYEYKPERLNEAHQWNKERAKEAMKMGKSPIVIDNTNTMVWEFKPYITMAVNNTYHVEIFEPDTPWRMKPSELARRNIHGVSLEHIKRMLQRYEHNVNLDAIMKRKSTPDLKTTEETELLSRFNISVDEKSTFSQGKDLRFHNLHKGEEFRKQKSGESDSDSLSSYHSDTWSNQSSRNASPKPLRSSLKTPGTLQKMEKFKPVASVKPVGITPTVRKVKRKAIKQIESKLSENTLKEVDEMVKEHVNGQILSVEDVSKTEGELKALLQFCSIDDSELTAAEELIGLKLHDAIHQSFEGSDPSNNPSGSCSDSDGDTKSSDNIPELMEPKSFNYVGNSLSDFASDINLEDNINDDGKVKYVCEPVKGDRGFDNNLTTIKDELNNCKSDDIGSGNETIIPNWKDIASLKKSSGSEKSNTCNINDTQVIDENDELHKLALDDDKEFELKYWGESDIKESKIGSNFETVEISWGGEKWENSDKDNDEISKPQRRKKNRVSHDLSVDNDFAENTSQGKLTEGSSIKILAVPNVKGNESDDDVCDEVNGDSDDLNNTDNGQNITNNLVCSEDNLISYNLEKQFTLGAHSNIELRNEENNTYSENSINLPPPKDNLLLSGRNIIAGNDSHSVHGHPYSSINSSLKLLKDSYTDTESAPKSSDNINHCDEHVVDEIGSNNVLDITIKDSDGMLKNEYHVDSIDVEVCDIEQLSDMKSMNMLADADELEKETLKLVPNKDVGTPKKKSSRKRQEDRKKVPFLNSEDTEKFKKADWSSFPLVSNETVAVSNNSNKIVKGKEMNTVATMTSIEYFNIEVSLNQGGFIGEDVKYLTGNPRKLVHSLSQDVHSDLKKVSSGPAEICSLEKSTTTADLVALNDSESVKFLRTCFPSVPDEELECVLEICSANVEWAINLLLDWKYSMNLTKDEKKNFSDKMAEIKKDGSMDAQMELVDEKKSLPSLLDICFDFIEKENIANRADIEHQLIKTSKDRLDTIEKDNITKIILQRSLSHGENSLDRNRKSSLSVITTETLMTDNAKYDVNKAEDNVFANDNESESKSSKKVNSREDSATNDDFVGSRLMETISSQALMSDTTPEPMMTLDVQPEAIGQLEDMFGSLECSDNVNSKLSVPIDRKTAWLLYQCVKNCLATSQTNHDEHQLLKDEELARKLQQEENAYKRVKSIKVYNGSRPKRGAPTVGYSVRGTIPSETEPVAWTRGNQSLAEIMREQQKIQDRENDFRRMVENEGAHSVISTRLKRQKLYEAFPKVDRAQLDEIFQASCFNLTDTIRVISTSLGEGPRILPTSTVMTPASSNDEQKLLEATKQKSVEDMLDSYIVHPAASKDYQDGVEPEYEDYRGEANLHHRLRHECFMKAREAYRRGLKQVASFYSQQGHQHTQKLKEANMRASNQILADRNNDIEKNLTLDLHGLHIDEAREALNRIIPQKEKERCKQLTVITGRGSHSRGGVAKLRPSVIEYLNKNKYSYTEVSMGVFKVSLKYRTPDR